MKKTILFEKEDNYNYISIEKIGAEIIVYKRNGVLHQSAGDVLYSLAELGEIKAYELGETLDRRRLYTIEGKIYVVDESWIFNDEAEMTLKEFKGKYKYNYNQYTGERIKSAI